MKKKVKVSVSREQLKGNLDTLILSTLSGGPAHGYAVISQLAEDSNGVFTLPEGTIYPALHRLEKMRLLKSYWADGDTARRRVYEITAEGRRVLREQRNTWTEFSSVMNKILHIQGALA